MSACLGLLVSMQLSLALEASETGRRVEVKTASNRLYRMSVERKGKGGRECESEEQKEKGEYKQKRKLDRKKRVI